LRIIATKGVGFVEYGDELQATIALNGFSYLN
jgi:hypothetical protein